MTGEVDSRGRIGILGGGQLGRMLALSGYPLGLAFAVLDPKERVSASKVCGHIEADYDDPEALDELAEWADVVTYEFENVPEEALERVAGEVPVFPPRGALEMSDDRRTEKRFFRNLGIETTDTLAVDSLEELEQAVEEIGLPVVLKTRTGGYDGKGQAVIEHRPQLRDAWESVGERPSIAEAMVDFDRELSVIGTRGRDGATRIYPVVENHHEDQILVESRAPAQFAERERAKTARSYCRRILEELDYVGTLALELFDTGEALLANEMAPRVHNSGHWTIEGTTTSQFENHVRAVAGLPLGSTRAVGHTRMHNIIGAHPDRRSLLELGDVHLHDYEKSERPGRKIGHTTVNAEDPDTADRLSDELRSVVTSTRDLG